jgi:hypothetical protein
MIDLSEIVYRAYEEGDIPEGDNIPSLASGSSSINLAAIKYRAEWEDPEEEEE